jgi:hypothetical protein
MLRDASESKIVLSRLHIGVSEQVQTVRNATLFRDASAECLAEFVHPEVLLVSDSAGSVAHAFEQGRVNSTFSVGEYQRSFRVAFAAVGQAIIGLEPQIVVYLTWAVGRG